MADDIHSIHPALAELFKSPGPPRMLIIPNANRLPGLRACELAATHKVLGFRKQDGSIVAAEGAVQ